ncbi:MAG: AAA family ATPase [Acidimicrobiia bacterium]
MCKRAKRVAGSSQGVIYAIEEPETSQHPEHQQILIQSLQSIAATANAQVLITTHSPQLLHDLPFESIRHVLGGSPIGESRISMGEDALFNTIMELGQLPMINSTCLICVEGKLDISFLRNLSMNIDELGSICDLTTFPFLDLRGEDLTIGLMRTH